MSVCDERGFLTPWLTFDEADNDPRRFLVHFQALLASVRGEDAQPTADWIDHGDRGSRSDWAIERLLRFGKPAALCRWRASTTSATGRPRRWRESTTPRRSPMRTTGAAFREH